MNSLESFFAKISSGNNSRSYKISGNPITSFSDFDREIYGVESAIQRIDDIQDFYNSIDYSYMSMEGVGETLKNAGKKISSTLKEAAKKIKDLFFKFISFVKNTFNKLIQKKVESNKEIAKEIEEKKTEIKDLDEYLNNGKELVEGFSSMNNMEDTINKITSVISSFINPINSSIQKYLDEIDKTEESVISNANGNTDVIINFFKKQKEKFSSSIINAIVSSSQNIDKKSNLREYKFENFKNIIDKEIFLPEALNKEDRKIEINVSEILSRNNIQILSSSGYEIYTRNMDKTLNELKIASKIVDKISLKLVEYEQKMNTNDENIIKMYSSVIQYKQNIISDILYLDSIFLQISKYASELSNKRYQIGNNVLLKAREICEKQGRNENDVQKTIYKNSKKK